MWHGITLSGIFSTFDNLYTCTCIFVYIHIPQLPIFLLLSTLFHDSTRPLATNSGHCLKNNAGCQLEDADTATSSTMFRNSNTQNPPVLIRSYRKVLTFRERMNRLLQLKNQYLSLLISLTCLLLVYDQQMHTCWLSDHQRIMINFM